MGTAYGTFAGEENFIQSFGEETDTVDMEDLGVDGRIST
jgi:hypothetical protein